MLELTFYIIVIIQAFFYVFFFSRFAFSKVQKKEKNKLPVSVIICANNEAENIQKFLPFIINQEYADFEIVLVNDHSTDNTLKVMKSFSVKHSFVNMITLTKGFSNKKKAVTIGINNAKYEHLLFIDADCKPNSKLWISEMISNFSSQKNIILGYGAYKKIKNSWLNKLIRFETLLTAIQYFSYAKLNLAYMGVGRNLAYIKSLFKKNNGFKTHQHIKSGDDDLFINQVANNNVACCYATNSFTISEPHTSFKKWIYQKRRHISTATSYKPIHQFLLGLFYISQFLFWFLGIYLLTQNYSKEVLILFILRMSLLSFLFISMLILLFKSNESKLDFSIFLIFIIT